MKRIFVIIGFIISTSISAQVSSYFPIYPKTNDEISITYNPYSDDAIFSKNDDVYAIIWEHFQDGELNSSYKKMEIIDSVFNIKITVNKLASFYNIHFITLSDNSWDMNSELKILIYDLYDKPVKNAHNNNSTLQNYENEFEQEINNYPLNFSAYRTKWFNQKFLKPNEIANIVNTDIKLIESIGSDNIEKQYALSYGYLIQKNYEKSIMLFEKMKKLYPKRRYTFGSIQSILYELSTSNIEGDLLDKAKLLAEELVLENISSNYSKNLIDGSNYFTDSCKIIISKDWLNSSLDDPRPSFLLATEYLKSNINIEETEILLDRTIEFLLSGKLRLYSDVSGKITNLLIPFTFEALAKTTLKLKKYSKALSAIKASQILSNGTRNSSYEIEGNIWFALKNYKQAEKSYWQAWKLGSDNAKNYLKDCYSVTNNDLVAFDEYFQNNSQQDNKENIPEEKQNDSKEEINIAPSFSAVSIEGKDFSLKSLKNKVVVMNFWFTGCGPCKQEIPTLNELVEDYTGKDVVFLAFALDEDIELLRKYLNKYPFKYNIIPKASEISQDYKIKLFPSHIIIDKNGSIVTKIEGGGNKIKTELQNVISRLL